MSGLNGRVILYTLQSPEVDITNATVTPSKDYVDPRGAYYEMARYLNWPHWIWCFTSMADFENDWMSYRKPQALWVLDYSKATHHIEFCSFDRQCKNDLPIQDWFFLEEEAIRALHETPMALVRSPITACCVAGRWLVSHDERPQEGGAYAIPL